MKCRAQATALAALALVFGVAGPWTQDDDDAALRQEIKVLEGRVQALESYAQAQAKAMGKLQGDMKASEEAGFTYGINPRSREILLAAFAELGASAQKSVPGQKPEPKEEGEE